MTSNDFFATFAADLAPNQDDATNGAEVVDLARETVEWFVANQPTGNGLFEGVEQGEAFLAWFDARRADLVIVADRAFDLDD